MKEKYVLLDLFVSFPFFYSISETIFSKISEKRFGKNLSEIVLTKDSIQVRNKIYEWDNYKISINKYKNLVILDNNGKYRENINIFSISKPDLAEILIPRFAKNNI